MWVNEMVTKIIDTLLAAGVTATIAQHKEGICKAPYVVVIDMGQTGENRFVGKRGVEILSYVPKNAYSSMETLKDDVKAALAGEDYLRRTGREQQTIYLSNIEGYMSSVEYSISKKL